MELPTESEPVRVIEGDALDVLPTLPAASFDLILTDPPFFGVLSDAWDNQWETTDDYLAWMRSLCDEWQRLLKPNGSLFVFASPKMAARVEGVVRGRFDVLNSIVWQKDFPCGALKYGPENFRSYVEMSERVIFAEHCGADDAANECRKEANRTTFGSRIAAAMTAAGVSGRDVCEALGLYKTVNHGGVVSNWLSGHNEPTESQWVALVDYFAGKGAAGPLFGRKPSHNDIPTAAEARRRFDELRRPFFADMSRPYSDVWVYKPVAQARLTHPCEKPVRMLRDILVTATRPGALVLDCFAGSGSLGEAALKEDRRAVLIERDAGHASTARRRVAEAMGGGLLALC